MHQNVNPSPRIAMALSARRSTWTGLLWIFAIWLTLPTVMLVLGASRFDFGFDIWPTGEFRNWIFFLQNDVFGMPKQFWTVDNRNALSPWWYNMARPLIQATPAASLVLQLGAGLFVGLSAYLLLTEMTRSRAFGLSVGVLSALFIPTTYISGVTWNFVGALGCSLLSVWLFAVFCNDRRKSGYLAASYIFWFVAFATYTLQVGAAGAVFFVSLRARLASMSWLRAGLGAIADAIPYAFFLAIYILIWLTTSSAAVPGGLYLNFDFGALTRSIAFGIWSEHYWWFWIWLTGAGSLLMGVIFVGLTILVSVILSRCDPKPRPSLLSLGFTLLIGACIVAPTVILEASSGVWTVGTRWPMVYQFWTPLFFSVAIFGFITGFPERFWRPCWIAATSCLAAFSVLLSLGFNHFQIGVTRDERSFFEQLRKIVEHDRTTGVAFPRQYIIRLDNPAYFLPQGNFLPKSYAETLLGHDVTFQAADALPASSEEETMLIWKDQRLVRSKGLTKSPTSR